MAKYLWQVNYTAEGAKGVLKDGGTERIKVVEKVLATLGGTLETAYFTFGDDDFIGIADIPDHASAAAVSLTVAATGAAHVKTTVLLTPEELDEAAKKTVDYTPPGQ